MTKQKLIQFLNKLPYIKGLKRDLVNYENWGQPGHFYNPIPEKNEVEKYEYLFDNDVENELINSGIDLNYNFQKELLDKFKITYQELSFPLNKAENNRYHFLNNNYSYSDSIFYYSIMRVFQPKQVIEIGSGYSSCALLDTNEFYFENSINCIFIEPYPDLLKSLLKKSDNITLIDKKIQDVNLDYFQTLQENDILFIDSSHVLKAGSDLNHIFFKILPKLKKGVLIHFHDIFFPFKYPKNWIMVHNRAWNEIYALRLLLSDNPKYKIVAFNTFLQSKDPVWFSENMPLCLKNEGGSIWIQKQ
jgi:predicted O-methyltransferase YrrM